MIVAAPASAPMTVGSARGYVTVSGGRATGSGNGSANGRASGRANREREWSATDRKRSPSAVEDLVSALMDEAGMIDTRQSGLVTHSTPAGRCVRSCA